MTSKVKTHRGSDSCPGLMSVSAGTSDEGLKKCPPVTLVSFIP